MVNYSGKAARGAWILISDNEAYVLQNKGTGKVLVKASDSMPTDIIGSIEVSGDKWLTSDELVGKVWCTALNEDQLIAYAVGGTVSGGGSGGTTIDREVAVTTYTCKTAFTGASVGDTITATQIIDVTEAPVTISTVWRNQSTSTDLSSAPSSANLVLAGSGMGLTDAQLRAAPISTKINGLYYPTSTVNSSTTQLAAGASFVGTPETVMEIQAAQIQIVCDQPYKVEIFQYIDAAGNKLTSTDTFTRAAGVPLNENVTLPGKYFKIKVTNLGAVSTTTFEVNTTLGIMDTQPRALTNNGNLPVAVQEGTVVIKGANDKWRDSFETDDPTLWTKSLDSGDFYSLQGNVQGAGWGQISKSALTKNTVSKILSTNTFTMPTRIGYGMSLSQRVSGELYSVDIVSVDPISGAELVNSGESSDSITDSFAVSQLSVSSNFATIYTSTDHTFNYDDIVVISGAVDTRVNVLARISTVINKRCVQISLFMSNASYNVGSNAIISKVNMSNSNPNIAGIAYYDTSTSNAVYHHRAQGSAPFVSGAVSFGTSYTDALIPSAQPFAYNMQARFNSEIIAAMDVLRFGAISTDSNSQGTFYKRTQVIPSVDATYALRLKATTLPNKAVPIEIVSATKTGSATATVVTSVAHGLETGAYVRLYGANNQTNWANVISESVITKVSETSFTVTWGTSTTGTIYGGYVMPVNGTGSITGAVNVGVLGTTWDDGRLFVGTTTTPSLSVGDTVRLVGLKDTNGDTRANTSGRFKVAAINPNVMDTAIQAGAATTTSSATVTIVDTSALVFGSIVNGTGITAGTKVAGITSGTSLTLSAAATSTGSTWLTMTGVVLEPLDFVAPANDQPLLAISSGGIIRETDMRINFVRCLDYTRTPVEVTGGHTTNDSQLAVPVTVTNNTSAQGAAASVSSTTGLGGWYVHPAIVGLPDIASAAITTTATSSTIANNLGNGFQVTIAVTAVSGTNPTMDVRIEESFDGGTNWVTLYEMQRITATGSYNTPILRATGRHIRYVRTIGGTSPSFTNAVTRNILPFIPAEPQKRLMDRSIVLTTLNSVTPVLFSGAANNAQLVINLGTATTPPALQLEGSEDGVNWYAMGAPLTGVASSTVQTTINGLSATFVRARVSTAGATVVAGYVSIKAWS